MTNSALASRLPEDSLAYRLALIASVLVAVRAGRGFDETLALQRNHMPEVRAAMRDIGYNALRLRGLSDFILRHLSQRPIDPPIHGLLEAALSLLLHAQYPAHTLVNQTVLAAAELQPQAKSFVNAILRNFLRQRDKLLEGAQADLEACYNHPRWWIEKLQHAYPQHWQAVLSAANQHPPLTVRVNLKRGTFDDYQTQLQAAGLNSEICGAQALIVSPPVAVDNLPGFRDGRVSVQDAGAQCAVPLLDVQPGQRVLDACAAPGGKTGHILEHVACEVWALDISADRLERISENLRRLGLHAKVTQGDASQPATWWDGKLFDRILADVPCSASGIVRRHPDIRWRRQARDLLSLQRQQAQMLTALWPLLKPGGKLLYATCSVFPEEGPAVIQQFLAETPGGEQLAIPFGQAGQLLPGMSTSFVRQHDGFYYAVLQKNEGR